MAKKSRALIRIEYGGARALLAILGVLPRAAAIRVSTWVLLLLPKVVPALRRTGLRNLEIAFPDKTLQERDVILRGTFENLGRVLGELSQFSRMTRERLEDLIDFNLDEQTASL